MLKCGLRGKTTGGSTRQETLTAETGTVQRYGNQRDTTSIKTQEPQGQSAFHKQVTSHSSSARREGGGAPDCVAIYQRFGEGGRGVRSSSAVMGGRAGLKGGSVSAFLGLLFLFYFLHPHTLLSCWRDEPQRLAGEELLLP